MKRFYATAQIAIYILSAIFLICTLGCETPDTGWGCEEENPPSDLLPIVFVHGMAGSADQFSLQAQRFASNGYPADLISGFEYDTTTAVSLNMGNLLEMITAMDKLIDPEVIAALDAHIDDVRTATGAEKVFLLGHSLGTGVCQSYLNDSVRADKVARYVNVDGMTSRELPGGVPTLALWAALTDIPGVKREITGATNVTLPGQTHVQCPTSAEGFVEMYKFFTGVEPDTVEVLPEDSATVTLAGKMITFATNVIPQGYTVKIYEVDPATGQRISEQTKYSQNLAEDGRFKFENAVAGKTYEFTTHSPSDPNMTQHYYYESPIRSNLLMRLKISEPDSILGENVEISEGQTNLVVVRDKEFVGNAEDRPNHPILKNDSLTVNGIELCTADTMPVRNATIGLYVFDAGTDGQDDLSQPLPAFATVPFVNALDLYIPAATPPQKTVSIVFKGRQNGGLTQVINVPNWSSATDKVTVQFRAF